jgi:hypothetical protein
MAAMALEAGGGAAALLLLLLLLVVVPDLDLVPARKGTRKVGQQTHGYNG